MDCNISPSKPTPKQLIYNLPLTFAASIGLGVAASMVASCCSILTSPYNFQAKSFPVPPQNKVIGILQLGYLLIR